VSLSAVQLSLAHDVDSNQRDVSPKDKAPKVQRDPIAAAASEKRPIEEVDGNRHRPKKQTNDEMFAPDGPHKTSVYQIIQMNTPVV